MKANICSGGDSVQQCDASTQQIGSMEKRIQLRIAEFEACYRQQKEASKEKAVTDRAARQKEWAKVAQVGGTTGKSMLLTYLTERARGNLHRNQHYHGRAKSLVERQRDRSMAAINFIQEIRQASSVCDAVPNRATSTTSSHEIPIPTSSKLISTYHNMREQQGIDRTMIHGLGKASALKSLELNVEVIEDASNLVRFGATNIVTLSLNVNKISPDLQSFNGLRWLQTLSLRDNCITSLKGIEALCSLEVLNVESNNLTSLDPIGGDDPKVICTLPRLRHLNCKSNQIRCLPNFLVRSAPRLGTLNASQNRISDMPRDFLTGHVSLRVLDLGRNRVSNGRETGEALSKAPLSLQRVMLNYNKLNTAPSPLVLPRLEQLNLSGNVITSLKDWEEDGVSWLPCASALFLQDNCLSSLLDSHLKLVVPNLKVLDCSFNNLARSHDILQSLIGLSHFESLNLEDNPCTDEVPDADFALACPSLRTFNNENLVVNRNQNLRAKICDIQEVLRDARYHSQRAKALRAVIEICQNGKRKDVTTQGSIRGGTGWPISLHYFNVNPYNLHYHWQLISRVLALEEDKQYQRKAQPNLLSGVTNGRLFASSSSWERLATAVGPMHDVSNSEQETETALRAQFDFCAQEIGQILNGVRRFLAVQELKGVKYKKRKIALSVQALYQRWKALSFVKVQRHLQVGRFQVMKENVRMDHEAGREAYRPSNCEHGRQSQRLALASTKQGNTPRPGPANRTRNSTPSPSCKEHGKDTQALPSSTCGLKAQKNEEAKRNKSPGTSKTIKEIMEEWGFTNPAMARSLLRRRQKLGKGCASTTTKKKCHG